MLGPAPYAVALLDSRGRVEDFGWTEGYIECVPEGARPEARVASHRAARRVRFVASARGLPHSSLESAFSGL